MEFDLIVRGGTVVDGSGLGSYRGDVGVVGDRIVAIGRLSGRGRTEIDPGSAKVANRDWGTTCFNNSQEFLG